MQLSNSIRQRIIELMRLQTLNFSKLSEISNVQYPTLISFMNGKNKTITLHILYNLCKGFNISLYDFFNSPLFDDIIDEYERTDKLKFK